MSIQIDKLHNTLCDIADYIFKICEENNLTCMLLYGTALGAYRHKGFIPWDDDMDLGMPREDYEKFIEIMKTKSEGYSIQNEDIEENYFLSFAKIRKDNTLFLEKAAIGVFEHNGIYVDIFPLDYVDDPDTFLYKMKSYYITYLKHILRFSACPNLYKEKIGSLRFVIEKIISLPAKIVNRRFLVKHLHNLMKSNGDKDSAKYVAQYDEIISRQIVPLSYYFPCISLEFYNKYLAVPGQIEKYLENFYGVDYMQLPPEDQRRTHMPLEIKF